MNNFAKYLTPKQAKRLGDDRTLKELEEAAKDDSECDVCGQPIWRYGHGDKTGLCFTCTTGQVDASEDYELTLII